MITLHDIELQQETIVIYFSYEGNRMNFNGNINLSKNQWINFKQMNIPDEDMIQRLLEMELSYLVDYMGD